METRIPPQRISPDEQHAQILPFPSGETGESSVDRQQRKTRTRLTTRGKVAVVAALLAPATAVLGHGVTNAVNGPEYSPGTHTVKIEDEVLWDVVDQVDGIKDVNKQDVISHVKEISPDLQDGVDPGDEAVLPRSVTP